MNAVAKPFQQATVDAACVALRGGNPLHRFLVADEVGLGKTVVAKEIVRELSSTEKKFTVYYVTSGQKVGDQNKFELLRFLQDEDRRESLSSIDRIGLIPFEQKTRAKLRLYALTPKTSFSNSKRYYPGKAVERAFIGQLIDRIYPEIGPTFLSDYLKCGATIGWPSACNEACEQMHHVTKSFINAYGKALRCEFGTPGRRHILKAIANDPPGQTIGRMRKALAHAALQTAPPDLIIFDEFQSYREIFHGRSQNQLLEKLLKNQKGKPQTPLLFLSATPYRIYAERWELGNHTQPHEELFKLIKLLAGNEVRKEAEINFREFGDLLHQIARSELPSRKALVSQARFRKCKLELLLKPIMSRTERRVSADDGSKQKLSHEPIKRTDLKVYRNFIENVTQPHRARAIAYWMSVPLPTQALGDRYQISRGINFPVVRNVPHLKLSTCYRNPKEAWGNPKLRIFKSLVPNAALALPWVLPSLQWWKPGGGWAKVDQNPKMLIFSRFKATPQSVASLVSLDIEREYLGKSDAPYVSAWKKKHLNPKPNQGTIHALFHPSPFLILNVDPLAADAGATIGQIRKLVKQQITDALPASIKPKAPNARSAKRKMPTWEVLAAIERAKDTDTPNVFENTQRAWRKTAGNHDSALSALIDQRQNHRTINWISRRELDALVDMAMGSPGVVVGRALFRHHPDLLNFQKDHYLDLVRFCWRQFRTYLDNPIFWSILKGKDATEKLQNASIHGCLEAVLDEHFWTRSSKVRPDGLIVDLAKSVGVNVGTFGFRGIKKPARIRIRCHVAVPFGGNESEKQHPARISNKTRVARSQEIREAFNTPFWPHVLATTSVGQEGLDFHNWCDSLGHWDLCSNPVDLEQREGRIQRFAGLSVRQVLAKRLGKKALEEAPAQKSSPWISIAKEANESCSDRSGLSPWWTIPGMEFKRHIFSLQQSRDIDRFARLQNQRLLYRLALGQPDQEDLIDMLAIMSDEILNELRELSLDLSSFSHRCDP